MDESEQCAQCGFDREAWTRQDLTYAFSYIAARSFHTLEGLPDGASAQRPDDNTWSMLEYLDHVREVTWAHRFLIDMARQQPGVDLGPALDAPPVGPPAELDEQAVLAALIDEMVAIEGQLDGLSDDDWGLHVVIGGAPVTVEGAVAHAMHDATHHMHDLGRIRVGLGHGARPAVGSVAQISVSTGGVPKTAVLGSATVGAGGVAGDVQRNRRHHGRPFQALCLWSSDVIDALRTEGHPIEAGSAGENLTLAGIEWSTIGPGTVLDIGSTRCEVTSYATPCGHNNQWFADNDSRRIQHERHPGWSRVYASVLRPGTIEAGASVVVEPA